MSAILFGVFPPFFSPPPYFLYLPLLVIVESILICKTFFPLFYYVKQSDPLTGELYGRVCVVAIRRYHIYVLVT